MDLKIQEYITAIEKYGNITEAASHLFITPSALNQQLLKLENDLGLPLFIRNRRKMIPTQAGSIYLDAAKQMLKIKQSAYAHIEDIKGATAEKLKNGRESAYLSYKLATIDRDCDVTVDLSACSTPFKFPRSVTE